MNQYKTERQLVVVYSLIVAFGFITTVCCAVAWNHWKQVLDVCPDVNCGCILYGISAFTYFTGGHVSSCIWVVYGPIPIIVIALIMAGFHMLRVCINTIGKYEDNRTASFEQREGEVVVMTTRQEVKTGRTDPVSYCWIPAAVFGSIFAVYCLVHASILTDGYYKTCNQYRAELIKTLRATGSQVSAIHSRLGCQAIFDFMDYLQPDVFDRRRGEFINTGLALQFALWSSWLLVFCWIYIVILNSMRASKDSNSSTCCGK